jgi:diguanylate cyclase (GGDEF)-like protein
MKHAILCVDDDELFLRSLARVLGTVEDVEVETATSVAAARDMLQERQYAIVVTDYRMPGETGIDLLEYLASERVDIVPVLTTAYMELEVALEAINRGRVFAVLRKPLEKQDVVLTIARAIERYELKHALKDKIAELERTNRELRESRSQVQRLHEVASTDPKTGTRSYNFFVERLDEEVARAERYQHPLSLALVDLDGFKSVNDRHGHVVGDVVLRQVAELMLGNVRKIDLLARFGGDEFALLLPSTPAEGAGVVVERLIGRVASETFESTEAGQITLSVGVVTFPDIAVRTGREMIELADKALYAAKRAGGNRMAVAQDAT